MFTDNFLNFVQKELGRSITKHELPLIFSHKDLITFIDLYHNNLKNERTVILKRKLAYDFAQSTYGCERTEIENAYLKGFEDAKELAKIALHYDENAFKIISEMGNDKIIRK